MAITKWISFGANQQSPTSPTASAQGGLPLTVTVPSAVTKEFGLENVRPRSSVPSQNSSLTVDLISSSGIHGTYCRISTSLLHSLTQLPRHPVTPTPSFKLCTFAIRSENWSCNYRTHHLVRNPQQPKFRRLHNLRPSSPPFGRGQNASSQQPILEECRKPVGTIPRHYPDPRYHPCHGRFLPLSDRFLRISRNIPATRAPSLPERSSRNSRSLTNSSEARCIRTLTSF